MKALILLLKKLLKAGSLVVPLDVSSEKIAEKVDEKTITDLGTKTVPGRDCAIAEWEKLYLGYFGIKVDLSQVKIPNKNGFDRVVIIAKELISINHPYSTVVEVMKKLFPVRSYYESLQRSDTRENTPDNLVFHPFDEQILEDDRWPQKASYAVCFRDCINAEEFLGLSLNDLKEKKIKGTTLMERMLLELKYFSETGEHLDPTSQTLCTGTRIEDHGSRRVAVRVFWDGRFNIHWTHAATKNANELSGREVLIS